MDEYIRTIAVLQVREILSNYGQLGVLWYDTPTDMNKERADLLLPLLDLQPQIITNNRLGGGYSGALSTPEQHIPATGMPGRDWETCMTMNNTWGFKSYDHNWKSTETLLRNLVDIVSKGGNYLLNVGPTALGEIPQPSIDRLKAVGKWMDVSGDSIYGTTASPFAQLAWGRGTKKTDGNRTTLYLHVFDWPADGKLLVPGLRNRVRRARLLATGESLKAKVVPDGVLVDLPAEPFGCDRYGRRGQGPRQAGRREGPAPSGRRRHDGPAGLNGRPARPRRQLPPDRVHRWQAQYRLLDQRPRLGQLDLQDRQARHVRRGRRDRHHRDRQQVRGRPGQ